MQGKTTTTTSEVKILCCASRDQSLISILSFDLITFRYFVVSLICRGQERDQALILKFKSANIGYRDQAHFQLQD